MKFKIFFKITEPSQYEYNQISKLIEAIQPDFVIAKDKESLNKITEILQKENISFHFEEIQD